MSTSASGSPVRDSSSSAMGSSGRQIGLDVGQWSADPKTGVVTLTESALTRLINTDPIEKWYILEPEPFARGQFAVVYHARHRITGDEFAAKFSSRWRMGEDCTADILHEVAVCAMIKATPRAVQLQDVFSTEKELVLVMEYAAGGDLQTLLDEDVVPYERDVINFTRQLLEGLVFIHDRNIVHLDIKPQNLVLMGEFPDCAVKLCDFEISRVLTPRREIREILGTPDYVAPEIILYEPITTKTDMWSLGVLTYVLLTGFLPFGGETDQETFLEISLGELDFPEELFEDISAEAIDFIKKLLIRNPQLRMSARECLEHAWMKADLSKAKIPPQTTQKSSISSPVVTPTPPSSSSSSLVTPQSIYTSSAGEHSASIYSPALISALSDISSAGSFGQYTRSCSSLNNTPSALTPSNTTPTIQTPNNATPTILTPMSSSPRDIGLPPVHPYSSSQRTSAVNSTHSSTNSLYRGGSRQSLDRARSLSKSREVLYERMQMSNQRKLLSKSRERLNEGRLALSRSREDLLAFRAFSHSEETLSVFSWLNNDDSLYQSCSSVFQPMLPMLAEDRVSGRLYKSLASIDKIDEVGTDSHICSDRQSIFDSRFSINDEDYNNLITRYNTAVNSHRSTPPRGRKGEGRRNGSRQESRLKGSGLGGRGSNLCDKRCSRHSRQADSQLVPKTPKISKAERMKRDNHRRRKGKKEKEKQKTEKQRSEPLSKSPEPAPDNMLLKPPDKGSCSSRAPSPGKRRGSVSHVEQRIQERHERQQEKLERQERQDKTERRGSGKGLGSNHKRRDSGEEKHPQKEKNKNGKSKMTDTSTSSSMVSRPRSISPSKRSVKKTNSMSSEGSPASSYESVKELSEYPTTSKSTGTASPLRSQRNSVGASSDNSEHRERRSDMDEAYVSLEEPVDDGIFSRSESMDSTMTVESDHTVRETDTSSDTLESTLLPFCQPEDEPLQSNKMLDDNNDIHVQEADPIKEKKEIESCSQKVERSSSESMPELTAINEEEEDEKSVFARSVSTSSDIGSMLSENSEADKEDSASKSTESQESQDAENAAALAWRRKGRSMSMQPSDPPPFSHLHLCRSNSFNLVMPLGGFVAPPWGEVCEGAVTRALEMFKLKPADMTSASRNFLERRASLHS
ncbi:uncharacterized protein [Macrobrachium rosenbergii]|uniref:uncharacterized protein isoform X1 n=2 Tax=Macrobrachium rosenbergii TaxID=79674 RepID=UPI0034D79A11